MANVELKLLWALVPLMSACHSSNSDVLPQVDQNQRVKVSNQQLTNSEAPVPAMCYTQTQGVHNPCYVCHQAYDSEDGYRMNKLNDGGIQGGYLFSDEGVSNHWQNLFVDRTDWVASISDQAILTYIGQDNYSPLAASLNEREWQGFIPDLNNYQNGADAFDDQGIAKDGSGWVAFNYKPFPGAFWPTNGATDDVLIRLATPFQQLNGAFNREIYQLNLALVEMTIKQLPQLSIAPSNELLLGIDLDQNGSLADSVSLLRARTSYLGDAEQETVIPQQYPLATEFMHSVRYVGVDDKGEIEVPTRMKELRYMKKIRTLTDDELAARYARERNEKFQEELPAYVNHQDQGFSNGMGWQLQGFIEDYDGKLRPQSYEESFFCMGCHAAIGTTIDQTFAFGRKVTGVEGWGYINLKGMQDAPSITQLEGEILQYLQRVDGGNEFRENDEMRAKWFNDDGTVKHELVKQADVYELITPSAERALTLNKAYTHLVRHQSFIYGRDPSVTPATHVLKVVDESEPPLLAEYRLYGWDLRLNWGSEESNK